MHGADRRAPRSAWPLLLAFGAFAAGLAVGGRLYYSAQTRTVFVDRAEVLDRAQHDHWGALAITVALLLIAAAAVMLFVRQRRLDQLRERFEAGRARHALERHYAYLVQNAWDIILLLDEEQRIVEANDRALAVYGFTRGELRGKPFAEFSPLAARRPLAATDAASGATFEAEHLRRDGTSLPVEVSARAMEIEGRTYFQIIARDITERRRAEAELRDREQSLATTLQSIGEGVIATDAQGRVVRLNPTAEALTGWSAADARGRPLAEVFPLEAEDTGAPVTGIVDRVLRDGTVVGLANHTVLVRRDGARLPIAHSGAPIRVPDGRITGVVVVFRDAAAERAIEADRNLRAHLLQTMDEAVVVTDPDFRVQLYNAAAERLWGITAQQAVGHDAWALLAEVVPESDDDAAADRIQLLRQKGHIQRELMTSRPDGRRLFLESQLSEVRDERGRVIAYLNIARDLTERHEMQAQLVLAERMAAVGTLAAGVAHEINNPLSYVMSDLSFAEADLRTRVEGGEAALGETLAAIQEALEGAERVRRIVRDLRTFSRPSRERVTRIDVLETLRATLAVAGAEIRHRARLETDFGPTPPVDADEASLGQALLNLLVNAAQAIPEGRANENLVRVATSTDAQGGAVIEVQDSGRGIAPENLGKIFDPFFTTRPVGAGVGLGLSITHGIIVTRLKGHIEVASEPDKGTCFRVVLPPSAAAVAAVGPAPSPEAPAPPASPVSGASGRRRARVLVVDDEPLVGKTIQRLLGADEVTSVTTAERALALVLAGERFDLLLCDVMMPQMTGLDLYDVLVAEAPEQAARVALMTAGAFTPEAQARLEASPARRLSKPILPDALRSLVADAARD